MVIQVLPGSAACHQTVSSVKSWHTQAQHAPPAARRWPCSSSGLWPRLAAARQSAGPAGTSRGSSLRGFRRQRPCPPPHTRLYCYKFRFASLSRCNLWPQQNNNNTRDEIDDTEAPSGRDGFTARQGVKGPCRMCGKFASVRYNAG